MRFYLDQMIGVAVAERLRLDGHDVLRTMEVGQDRSEDIDILDRAIKDDRILITLDHHFGDWVILPLKRHPGVIRVRAHPPQSENIINILVPFLNNHTADEMKNHLIIVTKNGARWIQTSST